jgi:hypothetical protein
MGARGRYGLGLIGTRCLRVCFSLTPAHASAIETFCATHGTSRSLALRRLVDMGMGNAAAIRAAVRPELNEARRLVGVLGETMRGPGDVQTLRELSAALERIGRAMG